MRFSIPVRFAKTSYVSISAIYCALGLLLVLFPRTSITVVGTVISVTMILCGMVKLVGYFSKDLYRLAFQHDLAFGCLLITLGIPMLFHREAMLNSMGVILGVAGLADGFLKVQTAIDARKFGLGSWILLMLSAVIACAAGIFLILKPMNGTAAVVVLIGISVLAQGVLNMITALCMLKVVRNQRHDVIEIMDIDENKGREQ